MRDPHGGGERVGVVCECDFTIGGVFFEVDCGVGTHEFTEIGD